MWKYLAFSVVALVIAGCSQPKKTVAIYPPLITADATPIVSSSKKSVGVSIDFTNITPTPYSYARFKLTAYNAAGGIIKPNKGKRDSAYVRLAGPIVANSSKTTVWTNTWKNQQVACISLDEVELIFPDGSVETATGTRLLNNRKPQACI